MKNFDTNKSLTKIERYEHRCAENDLKKENLPIHLKKLLYKISKKYFTPPRSLKIKDQNLER